MSEVKTHDVESLRKEIFEAFKVSNEQGYQLVKSYREKVDRTILNEAIKLALKDASAIGIYDRILKGLIAIIMPTTEKSE